jgi:hypothetical protein
VRDAHRLIIRDVDPESVSDLLRAPRTGPSPMRATPVAAPDPRYVGAFNGGAVGRPDPSAKAILHVLAKSVVRRELCHLATLGTAIRVPLRCRGSVVEESATGGGVPAQLARDRRGRPTRAAGDCPDPTRSRSPYSRAGQTHPSATCN